MRAAMKAMSGQPNGGHIFTMDGAGADGQATPKYAAYGATKAGTIEASSTGSMRGLLVLNVAV